MTLFDGVPKQVLTLPLLKVEAAKFATNESTHNEPTIYGATDGKRIGTYVERKFTNGLAAQYTYEMGSAALGVDFPGLGVDVKVTSAKQPQSSCPYRHPRQKIYGLEYDLLVFVYAKSDDAVTQTGHLDFRHVIFVDKEVTADFQTTKGMLEILDRDGNEDDLIAFMLERHLPVDDITALELAGEIIGNPPNQGYLTMSNALQWRLQFGRVIEQADSVEGVERLT